ncbi:dTDP-4-dehydrorhamnose reductase [Winogradskyella tangerina]|uniref:dTDP-4-dehydrorhamnose reductase n=1 Tax=Winogradskyella tangerina TaxID=2023240 RepID=UPI000DBE2E7F|nr:dTDP-4-dehydrorhamnose reductase [Winogradskyella tangerina]
MKSVAVLGASGQLGQTLNYLVKDADGSFQFFSSDEVDITDKSSIENTFQKNQFDFCINCAAYTNVEAAESDIQNAFLVNATGVKNVAEVCKDLKIKLIHISTDYVFDGTKNEPYLANDTTNPISQYGRSKLKGEKHIKEILADYYIIRTSWLYSVYGKNFMKTIINWILEDKVVNITTEETGTPTSCLELGRFILYLATSKNIPCGIYNFSARGSTTWFGFAREIAMRYDSRKINNINSVESFKTKAKRPKYSVLDISNTEAIYNKSLKTWQAALSETINLFKSQESIT